MSFVYQKTQMKLYYLHCYRARKRETDRQTDHSLFQKICCSVYMASGFSKFSLDEEHETIFPHVPPVLQLPFLNLVRHYL